MPRSDLQSDVDVTRLTGPVLRALVILVKWEDERRPGHETHFKGLWASHFARLMWPDSPAWAKRMGNRSGLWQRAGAFLWKMYKAGLVSNRMDDDHQNFWVARAAARRGVENMTCYKCPAKDECPVAWDSYNTNGECLNK